MTSQTNDTDGDGYPNNIDPDDDNDGWFDVDELYNSTNPLLSSSSPSGDNDRDGLSNAYETSIGSNPNDWDSDDDGISDGRYYPNEVGGQNEKIYIEIPSASASVSPSLYKITLEGYNQRWEDRIEISYNVTSPISGSQFLIILNQLNSEQGSLTEINRKLLLQVFK